MPKNNRYKSPRELGWRQKFECVRAGLGKMDLKLLEDKMMVPILVPSEVDEAALKRTESERIGAVRGELRRLSRLAPSLAKALKKVESKVEALVAERTAVERAEPQSYGSIATKVPAFLLVACEGGFTFMTLSDAWGFDVSQGFGEIPVSVGIVIGAASLLVVFVTTQLGFVATSPVSPRRRLFGGIALLIVAVFLAKLRIDSVAEGGVAFGVLGAIITIFAGVFAGLLQRHLVPIVRAHREHRRRLALASKTVAEAENQAAVAKQAVENAELRRKELLSEAQELAKKPQERAARRTEVGVIQAARLKAVRWYHAVGCRWSGKGAKGNA